MDQEGEAAKEEEDSQDTGFITKMFAKVAPSALGPSSLPAKVTPHHFQVCVCVCVCAPMTPTEGCCDGLAYS